MGRHDRAAQTIAKIEFGRDRHGGYLYHCKGAEMAALSRRQPE
jgi:hypothetical protein